MKPLDPARPEILANSLKHLIDEIIHVFPEGAEAEDTEIQGRICLRLLEQAQQEAARLLDVVTPSAPRPLKGGPVLHEAGGAGRPCHITIRQG